MLTIQLTYEEFLKLNRPINMPRNRWGGFQHLIDRIQKGIRTQTLELRMSREDGRRLLDYTQPKYGAGTYQEQLRTIEGKVRQALGSQPEIKTGSLFDEEEVSTNV